MIKKVLLATVVAVVAGGFISSPAQASHCPKDVKLIKASMKGMDKGKMTMGKDAAKKGLALHKAGKHGESEKVLHEAMEKLGIKH